MKKRLITLLISSLLLFTSMYAQEDKYKIYVSKENCGTYLPVVLLDHFDKTLDFEGGRSLVPKDCYDVLAVRENECLSDVGFHDGFALEPEEFNELTFERKGEDLFIIDKKGYRYKRISLKANCYTEVDAYVASKLFECIKDLKDVDLIGSELLIKRKGYYSIILDSMWWDTTDSLAIISGKGLKTKGMSGGLYKSVSKGYVLGYNVSDEELIHFPLLSYKPLLPLEEMEISELRLYRNLQFARHGYKFKSKDLTEIFSQFEWYHPKESNKGITLTKEEQDIVNKCFALEEAKKKENSKKKILSLSEENKEEEIIGVWYAYDEKTNEPYGYIFKDDGTFEYKDFITQKAKLFESVCCKGKWKISDNDIFIKIDSYKTCYKGHIPHKPIPNIEEKIYESSAFFKIGELETFEEEKDSKKINLSTIVLTNVYKENVIPFYYNKEDSSKIKNLDFYDHKYTTLDLRITYNEYLKSFFKDEKYKVEVFVDSAFPIFIAKSIIDEENNVCSKAVIYKLKDGLIDVLLNFEGDKISNSSGIIYDYAIPSIYGWNVKIIKDKKTQLPYVNALPHGQHLDTVLEMKTLDISEEGSFNLSDKQKGEMLSKSNIEPNYGLTEEVIVLPKGTDGSRGKDAQYVLFGDWPQTEKKREVILYYSSPIVYINGFKCTVGPDGCYYTKHKTRNLYYKMEPIKWCVISDDYQGGKLLLAEKCLDSINFHQENTSSPLRKINGKVIENYDYKYSYIRAWLNSLDGSSYGEGDLRNEGMLNKAFTLKAIDKINTVEIKTTDNKTIKDKLFLLGEEDVTNPSYGFEEHYNSLSTRKRKTTDYCQIMHGESSTYLLGEWWLRTPGQNSEPKEEGPFTVLQDGSLGHYEIGYPACVVPALSISF